MVVNNELPCFKVVPANWCCYNLCYEVGKTYESFGKLKLCYNGIHYCNSLTECIYYKRDLLSNHYLVVEPLGEVIEGDDKSCTNQLRIVRELSREEVVAQLEKEGYLTSNKGSYNKGKLNQGSYNKGNGNRGSFNHGDGNRGDFNEGYGNYGDFNVGIFNDGDHLIGICNNEIEAIDPDTVYAFNKQLTKQQIKELNDLKGFEVLRKMASIPLQGKFSIDTTENDYLGYKCWVLGYKIIEVPYYILLDQRIGFWERLSREEKESVYNLPNYDEEVFLKCLGLSGNGCSVAL